MKKDIAVIVSGAVLLIAAMLMPDTLSVVKLILFIAAFAVSAFEVLISAVKGITKGNIFNENTLMVVAAIGAFCIREYPEAVFVMLFYRVGELFEEYAVKKSRKSISDVMNICPEYANVVRDGQMQKIDPDEVQIGELISIAAGEKVPLDGIVESGSSFVDTSALTGESVPRPIAVGEEILSGCINQNGVLTVRVTKSFEDSTVSRILDLVETASAKKSKSEKFITKFAKYYTPIVLALALLLAVLPPLLIEDATFRDYVYRALSFLVVSCPCALVISVPLAFFGGIGGAAKKGILVKGGSYLESLAQAENAVFDKTGTLTKGVFAVREVHPVGMTEEELLETAATAESISSHPIAQSLREACKTPLSSDRIEDAEEIAGHGVSAKIDGKNVLVGNGRLMESRQIPYKKADGGTVVYTAIDGVFAGSIVIADEIKADAKTIAGTLRQCGLKKTVMLTGDTKETAERVAKELGFDAVYSELLPGDKVSKLEEVMAQASQRGKTVYVGDGINDAPVLARADVGIAMGALGSDAAIEAADVVIMTDEPSKIKTAVTIAKKTMRIAKENIILSLVIKIAILILCSLNVVGMGVAVFGDVGVMVLAVLNSFRALSGKE